ncbi:MAG: Uncharacterized protein XE11_1580 [Methanomicrobiales archaeon 53_19]|nr:MAG: Uncharacterized protein XD88_1578 [Methanocalculus sp. 52_23]KUL02837.1 MAG: Uncharacterized protein XE11_1580 [Methanomicrobiales archaeon 53_19]
MSRHIKLTVRHNGCDKAIRTWVSHGKKEIRDKLLGLMAAELHLSKQQFIELVDCTIDEPELILIYKEKDLLYDRFFSNFPKSGYYQFVSRNRFNSTPLSQPPYTQTLPSPIPPAQQHSSHPRSPAARTRRAASPAQAEGPGTLHAR